MQLQQKCGSTRHDKKHVQSSNAPSGALKVAKTFAPAIEEFFLSCIGGVAAATQLAECLMDEIASPDLRFLPDETGRYRQLIYRIARDLAKVCRCCDGETASDERARRFDQLWKNQIIETSVADVKNAENETGAPLYQLFKAAKQHPDLCYERLFYANNFGLVLDEFKHCINESLNIYQKSLLRQVVGTLQTPTVDEVKNECNSLTLDIHR